MFAARGWTCQKTAAAAETGIAEEKVYEEERNNRIGEKGVPLSDCQERRVFAFPIVK